MYDLLVLFHANNLDALSLAMSRIAFTVVYFVSTRFFLADRVESGRMEEGREERGGR